MSFARLPRVTCSTSCRSVTMPWLAYCLVALATVAASQAVSAGLVLNINTTSKNFFFTGSDTGQAEIPPTDPQDPVEYRVGFLHYFVRDAFSSSCTIAGYQSLPSLFLQGASFDGGNMVMYNNPPSPDYVFFGLVSSGDITALTGNVSSAALSYASIPSSNMAAFESLVGKTLDLSIGTGYSSVSVVQAVPEPSTCVMGAAGLAFVYSMWRRRKRV